MDSKNKLVGVMVMKVLGDSEEFTAKEGDNKGNIFGISEEVFE